MSKPVSRKRKSVATVRSTAGPGYDFEDQVAAWFLTTILAGRPVLGSGARAEKLQSQASAQGWVIDDLVISGVTPAGGTAHLAVSCKSNVQVTASGLPADFVQAAWRQMRGGEGLQTLADTDNLALVTRGTNPTFSAVWSDLKNWTASPDLAIAIARIKASAKHSKNFNSLRRSSEGATESDVDTIALIRKINLVPTDFQIALSQDTETSIERCRTLLRHGNAQTATELWHRLIGICRDARLSHGTTTIQGLWATLRTEFQLNHAPDFAAPLAVIGDMSRAYLSRIETSLPSGFEVKRDSQQDSVVGRLMAGSICLVQGDSGVGKSALLKLTLAERFADANQVWLGAEQVAALLGGHAGLAGYDPAEVFAGSGWAENILVLDAVEKMPAELIPQVREFLQRITGAGDQTDGHSWRLVVTSQAEGAVERFWSLTGKQADNSVEVGELEPLQLQAALSSANGLSWLLAHTETLKILGNLRILGWVIQAGAAVGSTNDAPMSHVAVADRIWKFWTGGGLGGQGLLMRLGEREASFERSFPISELSAADLQAFEAKGNLPLRQNNQNRIEFDHDLAADWARFQRLKELTADFPTWMALASNPVWNGALRLFGQYLLRQAGNASTLWDDAFLYAESQDFRLAADILLDALFLDPQADRFLQERASFLLGGNGDRFRKLLLRFLHIGTIPAKGFDLLNIKPDLLLHIEARYRVPIWGRWAPIARFMANHATDIVSTMSPVVAKVCETWLAHTPAVLAGGTPMAFRKVFAQIALATARALQVEMAKHNVFIGDGEIPIYTAALAASPDLPSEVSQWALEMVKRRAVEPVTAEKIEANRLQERAERAARLRQDQAFRSEEKKRLPRSRSEPFYIGGPVELPPWPLGATGRIEHGFRRACLENAPLGPMMRADPATAAEMLLALIIDDKPTEDRGGPVFDEAYGQAYDNDAYPTAFWKSPFYGFLLIDPASAFDAVLQLIEFCTDRWEDAYRRDHGEPIPCVQIELFKEGKLFRGSYRVFDWAQSNSTGAGQVHSAAAALEKWLCGLADQNADVQRWLGKLLAESRSVAILGVAINLGKYKPDLFKGVLRPLLAVAELYVWDEGRVANSGMAFDQFAWVRAGDTVFEMAKNWTFAPYRQNDLLGIARALMFTDEGLAKFLIDSTLNWPVPPDQKAALEQQVLAAKLDVTNYRIPESVSEFDYDDYIAYPETLLAEIAAFRGERIGATNAHLLPYGLKEVMDAGNTFNAEQAEAFFSLMKTLPHEPSLDQQVTRRAAVALASALVVCGKQWLAQAPAATAEVNQILLDALATVPDTMEGVRAFNGDDRLRFVAAAVFSLWLYESEGGSGTWDYAVISILTSGNTFAIKELMARAFDARSVLGSRWWRLLQVGTFWSALSVLGPGYQDPATVGVRWERWLAWLRRRPLGAVGAGPSDINLSGIAGRLARIARRRWRRRYEADNDNFERAPDQRRPPSLHSGVLKELFAWLLDDQSPLAASERTITHDLILGFWNYCANWSARRSQDRDDEEGSWDQLGYDLVRRMAGLSASCAPAEASLFWKPVLGRGPFAHYTIGHFLPSFFMARKDDQGAPDFFKTWGEMIVFMLDPAWNQGGIWFYAQRLIRSVMGFGYESFLARIPNYQGEVHSLSDLYKRWSDAYLRSREDNVESFANFLYSEAGDFLRHEGVIWLANAFDGDLRLGRLHRNGAGEALVALIDKLVSEDPAAIAKSDTLRSAVIAITAALVSANVAAALALQDRVSRLGSSR